MYRNQLNRKTTIIQAITLHLGDEFVSRFFTEDDAKNAGAVRHTSDKPAKIEFIPDGGGPMITLLYDPRILDWLPE